MFLKQVVFSFSVLVVSYALGLCLRSESVKCYLDIIISRSLESKNGDGSLDCSDWWVWCLLIGSCACI